MTGFSDGCLSFGIMQVLGLLRNGGIKPWRQVRLSARATRDERRHFGSGRGKGSRMFLSFNRCNRLNSIPSCFQWRYLLNILFQTVRSAIGSWEGTKRRVGSIGLCLILLGLLPCQTLAAPPSAAQAPLAPADVIILVIPTSSTSAHVGLVYRTRVPFARARHEIERLTQGTGWQIDKLQIEDSSPHPENLKKFPKTTGAEVFLQASPQITDGAPALQPYLRAFQAWDHLEVMFRMPAQVPAADQDFNNSALHVQLIKDADVYRYEVDIHDHSGPLPSQMEFTQPEASSPVAIAGPVTRPAGSSSLFALLLIAAGIGLAGCAGLWLLLSRRPISGLSARTFRQ